MYFRSPLNIFSTHIQSVFSNPFRRSLSWQLLFFKGSELVISSIETRRIQFSSWEQLMMKWFQRILRMCRDEIWNPGRFSCSDFYADRFPTRKTKSRTYTFKYLPQLLVFFCRDPDNRASMILSYIFCRCHGWFSRLLLCFAEYHGWVQIAISVTETPTKYVKKVLQTLPRNHQYWINKTQVLWNQKEEKEHRLISC